MSLNFRSGSYLHQPYASVLPYRRPVQTSATPRSAGRIVLPLLSVVLPTKTASSYTYKPSPSAVNSSSPMVTRASSPMITTPVSSLKAPRLVKSNPKSFEEMTSTVFVSNPNFEMELRKYKCSKCDKGFKTSGHLNRHKLIHTKSRSRVSKDSDSRKGKMALVNLVN